MTRRTSLQNFGGPGFPVHNLACGYLPEFPHDIETTFPREGMQSPRTHRLSHPHLTFASTVAMPTLCRNQVTGSHRNSQPSLVYYGKQDFELENMDLRHVPSQPLLVPLEKHRLPDLFIPRRHGSGPLTPVTRNHPQPLHFSPGTPPQNFSNSKNNSPIFKPEILDPVYLALKQATGRYGSSNNSRRGSSAHNFDSASPSPRNLSQVSLQDSGYAETSGSRNQLLGSTPMLNQPGMPPVANGLPTRRRAPKLNKQMKSLSLDCADMPPPVSSTMRSPFKSKPLRQAHGFATSGETSDWERSVSPVGPSSRRLPSQPVTIPTHVVTHEYSNNECCLFLGERLMIVDNGDPDWLHGIKISDRNNTLLTFPKTCVAPIIPGEQPMKLCQNVNLIESRIRLYRDQVVFAQPNSMREDRVKVRNERGTIAECPLMYLTLL